MATTTRTSAVPDLGGEPPSVAVSTKCNSRCSSRSKGLSRTSSVYLPPSSPSSSQAREKCEFGERL
uniref:Uncharacterized protein n=1 Tax=Meleagris gallopavo TaxID=9103 RepID=A0A803YD06_MELGA